MSTNLHPARPDMHRDDAAELLQREKIHHAIVVGEDGKFVGKIQNYRSDDAPPVSLPVLIL
jgi:CBS domain-containing protein